MKALSLQNENRSVLSNNIGGKKCKLGFAVSGGRNLEEHWSKRSEADEQIGGERDRKQY